LFRTQSISSSNPLAHSRGANKYLSKKTIDSKYVPDKVQDNSIWAMMSSRFLNPPDLEAFRPVFYADRVRFFVRQAAWGAVPLQGPPVARSRHSLSPAVSAENEPEGAQSGLEPACLNSNDNTAQI